MTGTDLPAPRYNSSEAPLPEYCCFPHIFPSCRAPAADAENPEIDFFIFDQDEFNKLLDEKTPSGKNKMYYFYFGETVNHHYIDDRERDKEINLDHEHNDWDKVVKAYEKL